MYFNYVFTIYTNNSKKRLDRGFDKKLQPNYS